MFLATNPNIYTSNLDFKSNISFHKPVTYLVVTSPMGVWILEFFGDILNELLEGGKDIDTSGFLII